MKDKSGYIAAVLSHITSKYQREAVHDELQDHMIEKANRLRSLGCSYEEISKRSESEMGDADVVGEQFERIGNSRLHKNIFCIVIAFLSFLLTFIALVYSYQTDDRFCYQTYVLWFAGFISVLINLFIAVRKKAVFNATTFLCGFCFVVLFWNFFSMPDFTKLLPFFSTDIKSTFFAADYTYRAIIYSTSNKLFAAGLCIFMFVVAMSVIVIRVRIDFLRNTRADLIFSDALSVICMITVVISFMLFAAVSVQVFNARADLENEVKSQLEEIDGFLINNLADISEMDNDKAEKKLKLLLNENGYEQDEYERYVCANKPVYISLACIDNELKLCLDTDIYDFDNEVLEVFDRENLQTIKAFSESDDADFYHAPPSFFEYIKNKTGARIYRVYAVPAQYSFYNGNHENYICYIYDKGDFELLYSDFIIDAEDCDLTEEQLRLFEKTATDYFIDSDYNRALEKFTDVDNRIYYNVYGAVRLNNSDVYEIYFEPYSYCLITIDNVLYDLGGSVCDVKALRIRFDNASKATVLEEWEPCDGDLYAKSIKEKFSKKAYEKWLSDADYHSEYEKQIEKEYNRNISGDLIEFDEDSGYYKITEFTDGGMATDNVTSGRLKKRAG